MPIGLIRYSHFKPVTFAAALAYAVLKIKNIETRILLKDGFFGNVALINSC